MQIFVRFQSQFLENLNRENLIWSFKLKRKKKCRMIDSEFAFNKLFFFSCVGRAPSPPHPPAAKMPGRFQIVSFLHVVYSGKFVNLSLVEITYIINTHQESEEI